MESLGARRERIVAVLGPSISQRNYEVGPEFIERFVAVDAANTRYFAPSDRQGHALFDLNAYTVDRLSRAGVTGRNGRPLHLCRRGPVLLLPPHHTPQGSGLRPADIGNRTGGLTMALHFERSEYDARRDRLLIEMAGRKARCHAALRAGEHVLADRIRHVRLLLLPVPGREGSTVR
jgi:hypothetical protein